MSVIFIVLPLALAVVLVAVVAYMWSARNGQFDDLDTPALRMLHDEESDSLTLRQSDSPTVDPRSVG